MYADATIDVFALLTRSAWNHLCHMLISALCVSETVQPMC